jgi:hypothetical protein
VINGSCGEGSESVAFHQFTDPACPGSGGGCDYEWLNPSELQDYVDRQMIAAIDPGVGHGTGDLVGIGPAAGAAPWLDQAVREAGKLQSAELMDRFKRVNGVEVAAVEFDESPLLRFAGLVETSAGEGLPAPVADWSAYANAPERVSAEAIRNRRKPVRRKARPAKSKRRRR